MELMAVATEPSALNSIVVLSGSITTDGETPNTSAPIIVPGNSSVASAEVTGTGADQVNPPAPARDVSSMAAASRQPKGRRAYCMA